MNNAISTIVSILLTHVSHSELMSIIDSSFVKWNILHFVLMVTWQNKSCSRYEYKLSLPNKAYNNVDTYKR